MDWRGLRFFTLQTAAMTSVAFAAADFKTSDRGNVIGLHLNPPEIHISS
jgi:hypothetical protein